MTAEALLIVGVVLVVAVVLGMLVVYRAGRPLTTIPSILEPRFQSLEAAIGRSDMTIRDEFGRRRTRRGRVRDRCERS